MAEAIVDRSSGPTYQRSARVVGVVAGIAALALAGLSAVGIDDLARRAISTGLGLLLGYLALRWALSSLLEEFDDGTAARLRAKWRGALVPHLATPRREGERARGDLALAIDQASHAPALHRLATSAATATLGVVVVFIAAGWLPLVITVGLLGLAAPLYQRAGRRSELMAREYQVRRARLEARQLEVLEHAPELRALGAVAYGADEIAAISDSEHALGLRAIRVALESSLVTEFLSGVSIGLVAMVVGFGLLGGRISLLRALVAVLVTSELFSQVRRYGVEFHRRDDAQNALAALEQPVPGRGQLEGGELLVAERLITEANPTAVSLIVRAGDRVVVSGPSGSGKTTLLHTLLGWRAATSGGAWRGAAPIGFVSVESALLSGSLRENLTLGEPIADDVVRSRLRSLGLYGDRLDDLDVELLSDGRGLSVGERVRLVLARALLANAALIVLDDVAGVLDADARGQVRRALDDAVELAVVEATVDSPLLVGAVRRIELHT